MTTSFATLAADAAKASTTEIAKSSIAYALVHTSVRARQRRSHKSYHSDLFTTIDNFIVHSHLVPELIQSHGSQPSY